jgi:hypothetical protein
MSAAPTKRQLAARHVRRLRTMRKQLIDMARQWEDLDQFAVNRLTEFADQAEEVAVDLVEDATDCVGEAL